MKLFLTLLLFFLPQLSIDLFNSYLDVKRELNGKGASGIPIISLLLSIFGIIHLWLRTAIISFPEVLILFLIAVLLHGLLVFFIPSIIFQIIRKNKL